MKYILLVVIVLSVGCASTPPKTVRDFPCIEDKQEYSAQEKYDYLMGCRELCSDRSRRPIP